jgi:hypothetical protein
MLLPDLSLDQRRANRKRLRHVGYGRVPDDTGGGPPGPVRAAAEALDRALALHVVVSVAGGLDGEVALRWAAALGVELWDDEREYLEDAADGARVEDAARATAVESLAELLWALGSGGEPPDDAGASVRGLPAPGEPVDLEVSLRPVIQLVARHDLLAGMAWALRADPDLEVGDAPGSVDPYVVRRRFQASAWLLGADW